MRKRAISITLDEKMIERLDRLAADAEVSRTAIIEKALENDLPKQESFQQSLENPVVRAIHARITTPEVLRVLAKLANNEMTDDEIASIVERAPRQREAASKRKATRKSRQKNHKGDA